MTDEMPGIPTRSFTRYSVESSRDEIRREHQVRWLEWVALTGACVVIAAIAYLLVSGGLV
jgi:hypothetical protein